MMIFAFAVFCLDPTGYFYQNSFQFRDEALSMMSFRILTEVSSAYLTVTTPPKSKSTLERSSSDESSSTWISDEQATKTNASPLIILYTLGRGPTGTTFLIMVDLTKEIADQVNFYIRV